MNCKVENNMKQILKRVVDDLHKKDYEDISKCIDTTKRADINEFFLAFEEQLDIYEYESIDDFETECENHELEQIEIFELEDESGFRVDYVLTSDGMETEFILQLDFFYFDSEKKEIKCWFRDIEIG